MGNKSSQFHSLLHFDISGLLSQYSQICECFDESLGRLRIFRKKELNYDYIALAQKLIIQQSLNDCKSLLRLCAGGGRLPPRRDVASKLRGTESANLWLRVYSCEVEQSGSTDSPFPLKICFEYLNFTLKEYLSKYPGSLMAEGGMDKSVVPRNLAYVLGCVLDAYGDLKILHENQRCLNILSMVTGITTPSLIYINVDRCLKFLPLPLFIFSDHFTKMEECIMQCCHPINQPPNTFIPNITIPKYGTSSSSFYPSDKLDQIFISKFKRMVKLMGNQCSPTAPQRRESQSSEETITANPQENKNEYHHLVINNNHHKPMGVYHHTHHVTHHHPLDYWELLERSNTIEELTTILKSAGNFPSNLQFANSADDHYPNTRNRNQLNKDDKIKLQKFNCKYRNSTTLTTDFNATHYPSTQWQITQKRTKTPNKQRESLYHEANPSHSICKKMNLNEQQYQPIKYQNTMEVFHNAIDSYDWKNPNSNGRHKIKSLLQPGNIRPAVGGSRVTEQENIWRYKMGAAIL